jgi:kynurenine formamidase
MGRLSFYMGDHSGTHVDASVHFDDRPGAKSIADLPGSPQAFSFESSSRKLPPT